MTVGRCLNRVLHQPRHIHSAVCEGHRGRCERTGQVNGHTKDLFERCRLRAKTGDVGLGVLPKGPPSNIATVALDGLFKERD